MSNERIRTYEGMFLFPQSATANLQDAADHIKAILDRCKASIISFRKWDDRRLAYEVQGNKRGVYFLVYFTAETNRLSEIERQCNLSEEILRVMVTTAEHIPAEIILRSEKTADSGSKSGSTVSKKSEKVVEKAPETEPVEETTEISKESSEPNEEVSAEA